MATTLDWALFAASLALVAVYEFYARHRRRTQPSRVARTAHGVIRADWARAIRSRPGNEILAVQTLRNSVMAASITGSTAVLAFVALVSQITPRAHEPTATALFPLVANVHGALVVLLLCALFAAFLLSATAVRFFNHAGYILATPLALDTQDGLTELGARYVARAGHLYSLSLRSFLLVAPFAIGLVSTIGMLVASFVLIFVLVEFDRAPDVVVR
ncbi:MAG: DUF599 domain-containing protein [Propionivibrio sp.]